METRKITIISTKTQSHAVINSAATTLGELKRDLRDNNIDYGDMVFYEGISKVELRDDSAILPHDIMFKGNVTNELVFMLTIPNKKIKSGTRGLNSERISLYDYIKNNNLEEMCKRTYNKNYTNCSTSELIQLVEKHNENKKQLANNECVDTPTRKAIKRLLKALEDNYTIEDWEKDEVLTILNNEHCDCKKKPLNSPYTEEELKKMFEFVNLY